MNDYEGKWGYSSDEENFYGQFDTKEEAIAEGQAAGAGYVGRYEGPCDPEGYIEAEDLIEKVLCQEDYDNDWADGTLECSRETLNELTDEIRAVFGAWIDRHELRPQFGLIDSDTVEEI